MATPRAVRAAHQRRWAAELERRQAVLARRAELRVARCVNGAAPLMRVLAAGPVCERRGKAEEAA